MSHPMFLVIARAADADPGGPRAEVRLGLASSPTPEDLEVVEIHVRTLYARMNAGLPERVAVAVLPWVDGDEAEAQA